MNGRRTVSALSLAAVGALLLTACQWQGANSLPLPGTAGAGDDAFTVQAQLPDVENIERNSRVRVGDVTVGNVTKIERQGWHALVTMRIDGDVQLPANATAMIGQTSLLGSKHIELAPPKNEEPEGRLHDGSVLPLSSGGGYPSTERTLAALSMVLNGGGVGQLYDITEALSTGFGGRENELRKLIDQVDVFVANLDSQTGDIISATESLNSLVSQFAAERPVVDQALDTLPNALAVLKDQRNHLADALERIGTFSGLTTDTVNRTRDSLVQELRDLGPVLQSLADAGPALTRSLSFYSTFPWMNETLSNWVRGDYANLTAVIDLTLSRIDASMFTGTRFEGMLTELEMQWGRTIGVVPSPYTVGNPLIAPYRLDQGR